MKLQGVVLIWALLAGGPAAAARRRRGRQGSDAAARWNIGRPLANYFEYFEVAGLKEEFARDAPGTTILEVGCGDGRSMMEMHAAYRNTDVHCINYKGYASENSLQLSSGAKEDLEAVCTYHSIACGLGGARPLPHFHWGDIREGNLGLPPSAPAFTHIISRATLQKAPEFAQHYLPEILRMMKGDGKAFLHLVPFVPRATPECIRSLASDTGREEADVEQYLVRRTMLHCTGPSAERPFSAALWLQPIVEDNPSIRIRTVNLQQFVLYVGAGAGAGGEGGAPPACGAGGEVGAGAEGVKNLDKVAELVFGPGTQSRCGLGFRNPKEAKMQVEQVKEFLRLEG